METLYIFAGIIAVILVAAACTEFVLKNLTADRIMMEEEREKRAEVKEAADRERELYERPRLLPVERVEYFLPWRPFHEKRLPEGAHHALFDRRESAELRAVMEVIEDTLSKEVEGLSGVGTRSLERAAGMVEAYLELHRRVSRMVSQPPAAAEGK